MTHKFWQRFFSTFLLLGLIMSAVSPVAAAPHSSTQADKTTSETNALNPTVILPTVSDVSPALSSIQLEPDGPITEAELPLNQLPKAVPAKESETRDASSIQTTMGPDAMPAPLQSFDGLGNLFGGWPPDTQGDIGPEYYVQWINLHFAIWHIDKVNNTATMVLGPLPGNTLFAGFPGDCATTNDGDPITLYDPMADRWLMSQFALPNYPSGPFYQCIAVSQTGNPTGTWYRYQYSWPGGMNDYPKFGVWPDAYYMTANQFNPNWAGAGVAAFNRAKMLAGNATAEMIYFNLYGVNPNFGGMLPADFDGLTPPPAGAPGLFVEWDDSSWLNDPADTLRIWQFHADFVTPANSTFGVSGQPNTSFATANVDPNMCNYNRACIPQPGTAAKLDAISDRLMYRLQYRNFGGHQTLVSNHTVDANGGDVAGIHWFELRNTGAGWSMYQQGTYQPDTNNRWMGSAALDHVGDLALGYSVSSSSVYPSVRYAGRLVGDPLGTLPQAEASLVAGTGSQTNTTYSRWGDYSMLGVDPVDDCTFWYTQEYVAVTGNNTWTTRIGSFKFPGCSIGPTGTLSGTVTDVNTSLGIEGATVQATLGAQTYTTNTAANGSYQLILPVGTYSVTASAYGYNSATAPSVVVTENATTTQNFALIPAAMVTVSGTVTDANTGWPLYAEITIDGYPGDPLWTDPVTGQYSVDLVGGNYTFNVEAFVAGYLPLSEDVVVSTSMTKDFALDVDEANCVAPGYQPDFTYFEDFEADNGGFVVSGAVTSWQWGIPTSGPGIAHSGSKVWATNLTGNYNINEDGYITSPVIDLSSQTGKQILVTWWQYLRSESGYDYASAQASKDGGTTWANIYPEVSGSIDLAWAKHSASLDPTYAVATFKVRFRFRSDSSVVYPGWYVDDIGIGGILTPPQVQVYSQNFDSSNGGYVASGSASSWAWGAPTSGPGSAHSAPNVWATNLAGNYNLSETSNLTSPAIDLSAASGSAVIVKWWQYLRTEANYDYASLEVTKDGGTSWQRVYGEVSGSVDLSWAQKTVSLDPSYAVNNFQMRFHFRSDSSITYPGWYVDDVTISYGPPPPTNLDCLAPEGGLVVGNVFDANNDQPMVGATVVNDTGGEATTVANPADLTQAPAFYTLFSPAGDHLFTATYDEKYGSDDATVGVLAGDTVGQDFFLPAGLLTYSPPALEVSLVSGASTNLPLVLSNDGSRPVNWALVELDKGVIPSGPIEEPAYGTKPFKQGYASAEGINPPTPPEAAPFDAGDVIQSWPTGITAWGVSTDPVNNTLWLSSPATAWGGNDRVYEFTTSGTQTGRSYPQTLPHSNGPADMTYNYNTGTMWIMNVNTGVSNCIFEIDPASGYTGNSICPGGGTGFATSQRGLAYDPSTDTYFAGSWNDLMVYRFASDGTILAQKNTGLAVAGLAYNPDTEHLFVMVNDDLPSQVFVLDVANDYAVIGQFSIAGFSNFGGGGFEMTCDGSLWAVDQVAQKAYQVDSGETTSVCGAGGVPWLDETPSSGTLAAGADQTVQVGFNAGVPEANQPGVYSAQLKINQDTPYIVENVPVTMTVTAPATWGKLKGIVTGLGYCDADPNPLENAEVYIQGSGGFTQTLVTDEAGYFQLWLDQARSPLSLTVTADEHQTVVRTGVTIVGGQTNNQNFDLRWLEPCMSTDPAELAVTVAQGYSVTVPLSLVNDGAISTTFALNEVPGSFTAAERFISPDQPIIKTEPRQVVLSVDSIPGSGTMTNVPAIPSDAISLVLDDGGDEDSIGVTDGVYSYQFIWLNRFTPAAEEFPFNLQQIQILFPAGQAAVGNALDLVVYQDADGNPGNGATLLATYKVTVQAVDGTTWSVYNLPDPLLITGPGDVLIAAINRWIDTGVDPAQYPAAIDTTTPHGRSWAGWWTTDPPDPAVLPPDDTFGTIDSMGFAGNWLIRGYGETGPVDVPWLSVDPTTGTVDADDLFDVDVTIDSITYTMGMHEAYLAVKTSDPVHPTLNVHVVMQVVNPALPVASFTTNSPVNIGQAAVFTNLSYLGQPEVTQFVWNFGDGTSQTVATTAPVSHTYTTYGTFHVTLTICNSVGCSVDDAYVVVLPRVFFIPLITKH